MLLAPLEGTVVFPNLRSLMHELSMDDSARLSLILSASLRNITFSGGLEVNLFADDGIRMVCKSVRWLERLTVRSKITSLEGIMELSALPCLQSLDIRFDVITDCRKALSRTTETLFFPSLHALCLGVSAYEIRDVDATTLPPIRNAIALLRAMKTAGTPLRELSVELIGSPTQQTLHSICSSIAAFTPLLTACAFHLHHLHPYPSMEVPANATDIHSISPLLQIPCMHTFDTYMTYFVPSNPDLDLMTKAWPHLTELTLGDQSWESSSNLTVDHLAAIAAGCPTLKRLGVNVSDPPGSNALCVVSQHTSLSALDLGWSNITRNFEAVAIFVGRLFPKATVSFYSRNLDGTKIWKKTLRATQNAERELLGVVSQMKSSSLS
ncbi:uncharacterized protein PHACADRAFT_212616 [Phanerochaete carnosa HHB-10118-sp]|uniref:F-box domain-containing protein n=1 Tax=Phanerochaete carnosa (strain HHB-10118-sp) TaxID=650164 RepID=K5VKT4_PHACS|nr:uncharacterized protein PHACADRAFT_212616 [Phanerochaete carnosa HHB-10118-sp]EKM52008.1 hypothetical protein PHACADRAFT_212616 [Phanerochaete carnosa HHB-10118-sp]